MTGFRTILIGAAIFAAAGCQTRLALQRRPGAEPAEPADTMTVARPLEAVAPAARPDPRGRDRVDSPGADSLPAVAAKRVVASIEAPAHTAPPRGSTESSVSDERGVRVAAHVAEREERGAKVQASSARFGVASGVGRVLLPDAHDPADAADDAGRPGRRRDDHRAPDAPGVRVAFAQEPAPGEPAGPSPTLSSVPVAEPPANRYPINLAAALQLAGSSNLQIALAQERVREAHARLDAASVVWVPNISAGLGYSEHAGRLQDIEGNILSTNRRALFVGGGGAFGRSPLAGGANPPTRLFVDLSPVEVLFEPLAARQSAQRDQADASAVFNDALLNVALVYLELVRAQSEAAIAQEAVEHARELEHLTSEFARTGAGLEADAQRARAELADRERDLLAAQERVRVASAELARLLRLDQGVVLYALETQPLPVTLIDEDAPLESLVAQGWQTRPELARQSAQIGLTERRLAQEQWRPWLPNLYLGVSGGTFGGGLDGSFGEFGGRYDLDALAVWELRNFGLGNRALVRERTSQHQQACLAYQAARDQVAADVAQAWHQSRLRRGQIDLARRQIEAAADALPLNFMGIRGRELRPIEAQQAIAALAAARNRYVAAVVEYNQAQLALWRAIGQPPTASSK